jgi:hypothetical protein
MQRQNSSVGAKQYSANAKQQYWRQTVLLAPKVWLAPNSIAVMQATTG